MLARSLSLVAVLTLSAVFSSVACGEDDPAPAAGTGGSGGTGGAGAGAAGAGVGGTPGAGAGGGASGGSGGAAPSALCGEAIGSSSAKLRLLPGTGKLGQPVLAKNAPGDDTRLFIASKDGKIRIFAGGKLADEPFYEVPDLTVGDEQGLLGLAFHPGYATNGRYFLHYSGKGGQTVVEERVRGANADRADGGAGKTILTIDQPESNHNGGSLEFGPDGMLYLGMGDGGGGGDQHGPKGNGQNLDTLLGKLIRIDIDKPADGKAYGIPAGNLTIAGARPEIWDYGLRNPWRLSFDACTGDLWIGDVGQGAWEEIDFAPKGVGNHNWGWRAREGKHCFDKAQCTSDAPQEGMTDPVLEYAHANGRCSVAGGYVYRGSAIPGLRGTYFFGDFCTHEIFTSKRTNGVASEAVNVTDAIGGSAIGNILAFGQDNAGELYVTTTSGVYALEAAP